MSKLKNLLSFLSPFFIFKIFIFKYRLKNCKNLEDYVNFAYSFSDIAPSQSRWEIINLLKLLIKLKPKNIVEIGTGKGGTLFLFSKIANPRATIISIDLKWSLKRTLILKSLKFRHQKIFLIKGDSHKLSTFKKIKNFLFNKKIDFLFIDGDHSYYGVKKDFEIYSKLVKKRGIIAFHDIVFRDKKEVQVPFFWRKIKRMYKHKEIVENWKQKDWGIGLIFK